VLIAFDRGHLAGMASGYCDGIDWRNIRRWCGMSEPSADRLDKLFLRRLVRLCHPGMHAACERLATEVTVVLNDIMAR